MLTTTLTGGGGELAVALGLLLLRASLVVAVAYVAAAALRSASAAVRAGVWRATFIALALLPVATLVLPRLAVLPTFGSAEVGVPPVSGTVADLGDGASSAPAELAAAASFDAPQAALARGAQRADESVGAPRASGWLAGLPRPTVASVPLLVWALGAGLLALRLLRGCQRAAALVRRATPAADTTLCHVREHVAERAARAFGARDRKRLRVLQSSTPEAPFVWDVLPWFGRPAVVLRSDNATGAGQPDLAVLLHEAEHLARRDGPALLLARAVAALLWPTPLVWLALRRLVLETERACDDAVLRGGVRPSALAELLVHLSGAVVPRASLPVPSMASGSGLEPRVRALLARDTPRTRSTRTTASVTALASVGFLLPLAALAPAEPAAVEPRVGAQETAKERSAGGTQSTPALSPEEQRAALWSRGLAALVALQDPETGAWRGDVGYKLNWSWSVTNANVPHVGVTGLAVEALVAAGQRRGEGPFGVALARGVDYLLGAQSPEGQFRAHGTRMREHAHALRALGVLAQAEGMTDELRASLIRGLRFSIAAQNEQGGWRFAPNAVDGDVQETAYQLGATKAAAGALAAHRDKEVSFFLSDVVNKPLHRAEAFIEAHQILDTGHPRFAAFRLQLDEHSRITAHTTAAGLLFTWRTSRTDPELWITTYQRVLELRAGLSTGVAEIDSGELLERHFETWDADLLTTRALEQIGHEGPPAEAQPRRDQWRAEELRRLAALEAPGGGWTCDVGPGDAYFTALGCLRLARPLR